MASDKPIYGGIELRRILFRHSDGGLDGIELGARVTIVTGASDTGKSTLVDAIRFLFGGKNPPRNPELASYQSIILVMRSEQYGIQSVERYIHKAEMRVFSGDVFEDGFELPSEKLTQSKKSNRNINNWFLQLLGCGDTVLLMLKGRQQFRRPTIRELLEFYVVDENRISQTFPVGHPTAQYAKNTADDRVLYFLLTGKDDRGSIPDYKEVGNGTSTERIRAFDEALSIAYSQAPPDLTLNEAMQAEQNVDHGLEQHFRSVLEFQDEIDEKTADLDRIRNDIFERRPEIAELEAMHERFQLLRSQYASDLNRLEMVNEAGSLIGIFTFATCPICGAEEGAQHIDTVLSGGHDGWNSSVSAEINETRRSMSDLSVTLNDLRNAIALTNNEVTSLTVQERANRERLSRIEGHLDPIRTALREMFSRQSELGSHIATLRLIARLQDARGEDSPANDEVEIQDLNVEDIANLNLRMQQLLAAWGMSRAESIHFDLLLRDVIYDGQSRQSHGKGARAILYAAFAIALNDSSFRSPEPFIGFTVLDSPLVTFSDPEREGDLPGDYVDDSVAQRFYQTLDNIISGQVLIIENTLPVESTPPTSDVVRQYHYTGTQGNGIPGLLRK